jgi:acetyl-CoA carboxylase carboxyl transferase subunit alpha
MKSEKNEIKAPEVGTGEMSSKESELLHKTWARIEVSRNPNRPHALDYIGKIFSDFEEIRGDRHFSNDEALIAGMGILRADSPNQTKVFFLANQKGRTTKQKIVRNFAMAKPEGYRKAIRLLELAEQFKKPVFSFIDTPGAFPGIEAEERGQSEAIAKSIQKMFEAKVPTIGVVIGEGGSGGALAIGVVDKLLMLSNSTYSVISPESCAAILWGQSAEAKKAARALQLSAENTFKLGICDQIILEPDPGAHTHFDKVTESLEAALLNHLGEISKYSTEELLKKRFLKYRYIDERVTDFQKVLK